jgi:hypothetical protein
MVLINLTDAWFVTGLGAGPLGMKPIILRQAQDKTERQAAALMVRRPEGPFEPWREDGESMAEREGFALAL